MVRQVVERIYVMHRAEIVVHGPVEQVLGAPRHAYTRQLIQSIPGSLPIVPATEPPTNNLTGDSHGRPEPLV